MKYELEPDNRNCSDEVLLEDLRVVAAKLGKDNLTQDVYNQHGRFAAATFKKRFGAWNTALEKSGLQVQKRINIPTDEFLQDMRRVAERLGTTTLGVTEYNRDGQFADSTIARRFGSWPNALKAAGLQPSSQYFASLSNNELFANMASVWAIVGRQPKQKDFVPPISNVSSSSYTRRFGSWRTALEAFVESANNSDGDLIDTETELSEALPNITPTETSLNLRRTSRDPGWRLRFLVLRRDRFTCRGCGRSPALDVGVVLAVDHIIPWSKGGETTFENLQALCYECNGGKSDLEMN